MSDTFGASPQTKRENHVSKIQFKKKLFAVSALNSTYYINVWRYNVWDKE